MAFNVGDIVRKVGGSQKYKVTEVLTGSKYKCKFEPPMNETVTFVFKETDLVLVT